MAVAEGEVNAEPVPGLMVAILQVVPKASAQIAGQTHVIDSAPAIEDVDTLPVANIFPNNVLMLFQQFTRHVFEVLTDERVSLWHIRSVPGKCGCATLRGPIFTEDFSLFQDGLGRFLLFIWWVAVFAQNATDDYPDLSAGTFPQCPINRHAFADVRD